MNHVRCLRHGVDDIIGELSWVRRCKAHTLQPLNLAAGAQQLGKSRAVAFHVRVGEVNTIGVDILSKEGDVSNALLHECLHLSENLAWTTIAFLTTQTGDDAEGARVVAAYGDTHPTCVSGFTLGRQHRGKFFQRVLNLDFSPVIMSGAFQQCWQRTQVMRTEDNVHPWGLLYDDVLILLGQAATDGNLHAWVSILDWFELSQRAIKAIVRILSNGTGVENDQIRIIAFCSRYITVFFQQARQSFRVMDVHLTTERTYLICARRRLLLRVQRRGSHGSLG